MKIWKVILAAVVIFVTGFVTGGLSVKLSRYGEAPAPRRGSGPGGPGGPRMPMGPERQMADLMRRMESRLDLSETQDAQIRQIILDGQARIRATWKELAPRMRGDFTAINDQIREVLTPDQRVKFEELTRHRSHGRPEGYKRGEPGSSGPERRQKRPPADASSSPAGEGDETPSLPRPAKVPSTER